MATVLIVPVVTKTIGITVTVYLTSFWIEVATR
jgi:hypothetical protein